MKRPLLHGIMLLIIASSLPAQAQLLSSSLFIQQDKETEAFQCIQIRRRDKITLKGTVLFEGWEEMPAEMEVSNYKPSEKN